MEAASLAPLLGRIETAIEALGRPKLEVELQTPAVMEDLLQQQVILVERTLVPIVKAATKTTRDKQALNKKLSEVLAMLRTIDAQMRGGAQLPPG